MPLCPYSECGNPCADDAITCPKCGHRLPKRETPKSEGISAVRLECLALGPIAALVVLAMTSVNPPPRSADATGDFEGRAARPAPAPKPYQPTYLLRSYKGDFTWHEEYGYAVAEGRLTNITSEPLDSIAAAVEFETASGTRITAEESPIEYQPIMPGQTSPFKVMVIWNPAMKGGSASLRFRRMFGDIVLTDFATKPKATPKSHRRKSPRK